MSKKAKSKKVAVRKAKPTLSELRAERRKVFKRKK
jgi:hypothetical protein